MWKWSLTRITLILSLLTFLYFKEQPTVQQVFAQPTSQSSPVGNINMPDVLMHIVANDGSTWVIEKVHCRQFPDWADWSLPDVICPYLGLTQAETHTVYILRGQTKDDEQATVLHELMHVAVGVDRSEEKTTIHGAIYTISERLIPILQHNPELLSYLQAK